MTQLAEPSERTDSSRPVLGVAVLLFAGLLGIAGFKGSRDLQAARERELLLERRIAATQGRIEELRGRIDRLRSDPVTLERLAREDLGMVRPGDLVIELPAAGAVPPRAPAPAPPAPAPPAPAPLVPAPPSPTPQVLVPAAPTVATAAAPLPS